MDGYVIQLQVIGDFAVGFFSSPNDEITGLSDTLCFGFQYFGQWNLLLGLWCW